MSDEQPKNNLIKSKKREFSLEAAPDAYIICVHMRNMMATMGEQFVREVILELFFNPELKKGNLKTANNGQNEGDGV